MAGRLPEPSAIGPPYPVLTPAVSSRVRPAMHGKRLLGWMVGTQCGLSRKTTGCNFCWSVLLASGCIFHLALWGLLLKVSPTMCQALHCPLDEVASVKPPGSSPNLGLLSSVAHPAPMPFVPAWLLWDSNACPPMPSSLGGNREPSRCVRWFLGLRLGFTQVYQDFFIQIAKFLVFRDLELLKERGAKWVKVSSALRASRRLTWGLCGLLPSSRSALGAVGPLTWEG